MFHSFAILIPYIIATIGIVSGYYFNLPSVNFILGLSLTLLFIWDLLFVTLPNNFAGRSVKEINDSITRARTYLSWFLGIYSIVFGLMFSGNDLILNQIQKAMHIAELSLGLILFPLILSFISMLFVPIKLDNTKLQNEPNNGIKALFLMVVFFQKAVLILMAHLCVRIFSAWSSIS